mmetsp:Transcript_28043/g.82457  ORF Transcript_28043/g.82457 Transcript_28043/m.82457 type:complete len:176 (+) Transcript_28043:183-710(+)
MRNTIAPSNGKRQIFVKHFFSCVVWKGFLLAFLCFRKNTIPGVAAVSSAMPFRQYKTAGDIPSGVFKRNTIIYGRVEKVIDGDTLRIRHYPFYPLKWRGSYDGKLTQNTISVRIYGVDAPELAHFGNPSMPFAEEAKHWLCDLVDGKIVRVKLLRKDQYSRAVAKVMRRCVSLPW